jgi:NitT/TauT family transport system substrate-binding protein
MKWRGAPLLLAATLLGGATLPSQAAQKISVGRAVGSAWTFLPLNIGKEYGIFARYGLDVKIVNFHGDASLEQGLASNSISFGLGSGPAMAFSAKGAPVIAVAAFYDAPRDMALVVNQNSPIRSAKDLKGKSIGVSSQGSLTMWLVQRVSLAEGWGNHGIETPTLGAVSANVAAMRAGEIDGLMAGFEDGAILETKRVGHTLLTMDKFVPVFITHVVLARNATVASDPSVVTRFLEGFFASIDFMKTRETDTNKVAEEVLQMSPAVAEEAYNQEVGGYETDGTFNLEAVGVLKRSFVSRGILPKEPEDSVLFTTRFLPVKFTAFSASKSLQH